MRMLDSRLKRRRFFSILLICGLVGVITTSMNACAPGFDVDESLFGSSTFASASVPQLKQSCNIQSEDAEVSPIQRLTTDEYKATVYNLLQCQFNCFGDFSNAVSTAYMELPLESTHDSISTFIRFSNTSQTMNEERIRSYHSVAQAVAKTFESISDRTFLINFAFDGCWENQSTVSEACYDKMLRNFGLRAFRRPITDTQLAQAKAAMAAGSSIQQKAGLAAYYFMMSPDFIYHLESDGTRTGDILKMDSYGVAAKISYLFAGRPPDAELYNRASQGKIQTAQEIDSAIEYLRSTYTQDVRDQLWKFTREWLAVSNSTLLTDPKTAATALPDINVGSQWSSARDEMNQELRDMIEFYIFQKPSTYKTLFTNQNSFAKSATVASLYKTPAWNGSDTTVAHTSGQRRGFLTTAALLTSGGSLAHPFTTGGLIHKHILCREFGNQGEPQILQGLDPSQNAGLVSTRTRYERLVPRQSACMSCHAAIEGLGMPFQTYDQFGRWRAGEEKIYSSDGSYAGSVRINSQTTALVGSATQPIDDALDLIDRIAETSEPQACLAKQFFRFAYARKESARDACTLYRFADKLEKASIWDALKSFASDQWFQKRKLE